MGIYDFSIKTQEGGEVSLSGYEGKVLLIVNTATGCGFTPQYDALQELYEEYHEKGLEILDIPCNQFGGQAPGSDEEIHSFCTGRYGIAFSQFAKAEVIGAGAIPLFKWLAENSTFEGFGKSPMGLIMSQAAKKMDKDYRSNGAVKWNFTKFLIDRKGNVAGRFEPTTAMKKVKAAIEEVL